MFIKVTKNKQGQAYYHLVESYRDQGKVRQRTLMSLGKAGEDRLEELVTAIGRHKDVVSVLQLAKELSVEDTYILGPLLALEQMFKRFGVYAMLDEIARLHPKLEFNLRRIVFTLVVCRFIKPGSKLQVFEHWQDKLYPKMLSGKDELHHLYRALDLLAKHKEQMESALYAHGRDLLNREVDVVLYDLTTLRFESTREDIGELRRFGYSKEMRTDCTQVVLGLLVDARGIPLSFEVFPGNTFEGKTLVHIVSRMRNKFQVRRFIFVADRGLFSKENLEHIRTHCGGAGSADKPDKHASVVNADAAHQVASVDPRAAAPGEFIVGMKLGNMASRHEEFYDKARFTALNEDLSIYETTYNGDRCIITWSRSRAERDRKTREDILGKIKHKLAAAKTNAKQFVSNTNYRKYVSGLAQGSPALNESAVENQAHKDGFFGVITNVKNLTSQEIITAYKNLWIVEDAFGEIKGSLKTRPVFHWSDQRIVGHLSLCFIAYYCEAHMTALLRQSNAQLQSTTIDAQQIKPRPLTVTQAMRELTEVRAIPITLRGQTCWVRTDINGNAATLFKAIGVGIPSKLLSAPAPQ